jgi:protein-L-isoaspartate(D-aspartate) O-methyltransferase
MGEPKMGEVILMTVLLMGLLLSTPGCLGFPGCKGSSAPPPPGGGSEPEAPSQPEVATPAVQEATPSGDAIEARRRLVRAIHADGPPWPGSGPWSERVLDVMREVERHRFMPPGTSLAQAYADRPHPIGHGQTISQPTVVAMMTQALELSGKERVLEIGTGSAYQAAVLSRLAERVYSIEIVEPLGIDAKERLARLGYDNVEVRIGDGYQGWPEHAPFDRIILTAAPPRLPEALVEQLGEGGLLVAPVGDLEQRLVRWTKRDGRLEKEDLASVRFVPMVPGE